MHKISSRRDSLLQESSARCCVAADQLTNGEIDRPTSKTLQHQDERGKRSNITPVTGVLVH